MSMSTSQDELWRAVHAAFPYTSDVVQAEINRIAAKCLKKAGVEAGLDAVDSSTCDVIEVGMTGNELASLIRYHDRAKLTGRSTPIVVVRTDGKDIVIEGNNRVNNWVNCGDVTTRRVLVIIPRAPASTA
jgi:hypothetical protein